MKVIKMGEDVVGVRLEGDRRNPEKAHFRVCFPGGDLEVVRATEGEDADYWVHIRVNNPKHNTFYEDGDDGPVPGEIVDARLDLTNKHSCDADLGDFKSPHLYHLAVRVRKMDANTKNKQVPKKNLTVNRKIILTN